MTRPYDNIPRQGEHLDDALDAEPTTNVRAQDAPHPPSRSKETQREHVLLENTPAGRYRLRSVAKGAGPEHEDAYEVLARVPEAGDVDALYGRIPDQAQFAVFEHTEEGTVFYAPSARPSGDWTHDGMFDQVTIFMNADEAEAFLKTRREEPSAE